MRKQKNRVVKNTLPQVQNLRFGVDYIRFNFSKEFPGEYFKGLLDGLSMNSNQKTVNFFGHQLQCVYTSTANKQILNLSYFGDSVCCLEKIDDAGIMKTIPWVLVFYSTYFMLDELCTLLPDVIKFYGRWLSVSRVDLALDVNCSVDELWACHRTQSQKIQTYVKDKQRETFYLGAKKHNQRHYVRVYNKKLDSQKKGKFHLFLGYMELPVVSRIEVQMNSLSCKEFCVTPRMLLEEVLMKDLFSSCCLNKSTTDFSRIDIFSNIIRPKRKKRLDDAVLDELQYARVALGYVKRLHELGFPIISYLQKRLSDLE